MMDLPWIVIGDFNELCYQHEKFGGKGIKKYRATTYLNCMASCGLLDMDFSGHKFKWSNKRKIGPIMERLDMA